MVLIVFIVKACLPGSWSSCSMAKRYPRRSTYGCWCDGRAGQKMETGSCPWWCWSCPHWLRGLPQVYQCLIDATLLAGINLLLHNQASVNEDSFVICTSLTIHHTGSLNSSCDCSKLCHKVLWCGFSVLHLSPFLSFSESWACVCIWISAHLERLTQWIKSLRNTIMLVSDS